MSLPWTERRGDTQHATNGIILGGLGGDGPTTIEIPLTHRPADTVVFRFSCRTTLHRNGGSHRCYRETDRCCAPSGHHSAAKPPERVVRIPDRESVTESGAIAFASSAG